MKIYKIQKTKKNKKKPKSHVGEIGPMYVGKDWSGKLDTRLEPAHRYTLQKTNAKEIESMNDIIKKSYSGWYKKSQTDTLEREQYLTETDEANPPSHMNREERDKLEYDEELQYQWEKAKEWTGKKQPDQEISNPDLRPFFFEVPRIPPINDEEAMEKAKTYLRDAIKRNLKIKKENVINKMEKYLDLFNSLVRGYNSFLKIKPSNNIDEQNKKKKDLQYRCKANDARNNYKIFKALIELLPQ